MIAKLTVLGGAACCIGWAWPLLVGPPSGWSLEGFLRLLYFMLVLSFGGLVASLRLLLAREPGRTWLVFGVVLNLTFILGCELLPRILWLLEGG